MRPVLLLFVAGLMFLIGCGGDRSSYENVPEGMVAQHGARGPEAGDEAQPEAAAEAPLPRKIIYTAQVSIIVEDFDKVQQELTALIEQFGAYVAGSKIQGSPGSRRTGTWTVRVPVDHFDPFMDAVVKLGELEQRQTSSDDITDRYYDLQARLKNNQAEEDSLRKLLETIKGKEEYLAVRRELREIRGQIEAQQGQIKRWDKLTELTTVTVTVHERKGYVPPEAPPFSTAIGRTFSGSLSSLVDFGKWLVLVVVALVPWLPVIGLVVVPSWLLLRRWRRWRPTNGAIVEGPSPMSSE